MTLQPVAPPHLLTVTEYLEIGPVEPGYSELVEGRLLMSPSPVPDRNRAALRLAMQLEPQLPNGLEVIPDLDVDLQLAPDHSPGTVRRPDLVVVPTDARLRIRHEGGVLRASDVVLVVELVSPGSRRIDHVHKRSEYADAGIGHYWIIDVEASVSLLACHRAGELGYRDGGTEIGRYTTTSPFPVTVDLTHLL